MEANSTVDGSARAPEMGIFATHAVGAADRVGAGIGRVIAQLMLGLAYAAAKPLVQPSVIALGSSTTAGPCSTRLGAVHLDKVRPAPPAPRIFLVSRARRQLALVCSPARWAAHCGPVSSCAGRCTAAAPSAYAPTTL